MLKTNSKKARKNIQNYIHSYAAEYMRDDYDAEFSNERELCAAIFDAFRREALYPNNIKLHGGRYYDIFKDWAQGLPIGQLFCYWWNRSAHDDLAALLEETPAEAARFTEEQACDCLTRLIFRAVQDLR